MSAKLSGTQRFERERERNFAPSMWQHLKSHNLSHFTVDALPFALLKAPSSYK